MKFFARQLHINSLIIAVILAAIQIYVLWETNGAIGKLILEGGGNLDTLMLIFSPTAGLVWTMKKFAEQPLPPKENVPYGAPSKSEHPPHDTYDNETDHQR